MFAKVSILLLSVAIAVGGLTASSIYAEEVTFTMTVTDRETEEPVTGLWWMEIHFYHTIDGDPFDGAQMEEEGNGVYRWTEDCTTEYGYWDVILTPHQGLSNFTPSNPTPRRNIWWEPLQFNWWVDVAD